MISELPLLHVRRRKGNSAALRVELFVPCPDAVCPITQDSIVESELSFLPDVAFDKDVPCHRGMKLSCGHEFSAMNLVYHWARNRSVVCPVCRGGKKGAYLDLRKLPSHFGPALTRKVRAERRMDLAEVRREHEEAALQIQREGAESLMEFAPDTVCMGIYRRFAVLGQVNEGLRMPCDMRLVGNNMLFTCRVAVSVLVEMEEFKLVGMLRTDDYESKFPETDWCHFTTGHDLLRVCVEAPGLEMPGYCYYTVRRCPDGVEVEVEWALHVEFLGYMMDCHRYAYGLRWVGGFVPI